MATTDYVVLRRSHRAGSDDVTLWEALDGVWPATGATKAARNAAEAGSVAGEYVAVPARSFASVLVEFVNEPRTRVSVVQEEIPAFPKAEPKEEPAKS